MIQTLKTILSQDDAKNGLHVDVITDRTVALGYNAGSNLTRDQLKQKINKTLLSESKKKDGAFLKVKNPKTNRERKGYYKLARRRNNTPPLPLPAEDSPVPTQPQPTPPRRDTIMSGKAGEYAVLSELLFNGYNANVMSVDEGIDLVASKNNIFYFIQVKTTNLSANRTAHFGIKKSAFDRGIASQIRYIVVVRCGKGEMRYFKFTEDDITRFVYSGLIAADNGTININIRFEEDDRKPYIYRDSLKADISYHQNNFDL